MRARTLLFLLVVPLALFGPVIASGRLLLPLLPGGLEPLASEDPARAAAALEHASYAQSDRLFPVLTDQLAMREELLAGSLPTWEPKLGLGYPLLGGSIAALAYPPNLVGVLASPAYAAAPLALLASFLAGLGALLFLRRLGLGVGPALVGVLAYQLGGFGLGNVFYGMKVDAALWLPWSLWALEGLRERRRGSAAWLGASVALSFLAGFVPIAVFHLVVAGAWALVRLTGSRGAPPDRVATAVPRLVLAGLTVAAGLAIAAVGVLPLAATSTRSIRAERTRENLVADSLPASPRACLGLVVRDFVDRPTSSAPAGSQPIAWWITPEPQLAKANEKANALEWNLFVGASVVALALVGLLSDPRRARFPALALLVVVAFAQTWHVARPLLAVPGLNVGSPSRVLSMAWFLWPWLAALGVGALGTARGRRVALGVALVGAVGLGASALSTTPDGWAEHAVGAIVAEYGDGHGIGREEVLARVGGPEALLEAGARLREGLAAAAASLLALALAVVALTLAEVPARPGLRALRATAGASAVAVALAPLAWIPGVPVGAVPLVVVVASGTLGLAAVASLPHPLVAEGRWLPVALVVALEGLGAASGHVTARAAPANGLFPDDSPALTAVVETAGDGRVLRFDPTGVSHVENLARPNFLEPYGVGDLGSWIVFTPRTLVELAGAVDRRPGRDMRFRTGVAALRSLDRVAHPLFDAWNVTCVLSREPLEHPLLTETFARPGFHVYRRAGALGPARLVGDAVVATSDEAAVRLLGDGVVRPRDTVVLGPDVEPRPPVDADGTPAPTLTRPARNRVDVEVADGPGGWLVLAEQWAPGWSATIDGDPVPVERADHALRAVYLPPGPATVRFAYAPPSLAFGALLGLLGIAALWFLEARLLRARDSR